MIKRILVIAAAALVAFAALPFSAAAEGKIVSEGKSYTVEYSTPVENAYPNLAYTPEEKLTDGKKSSADYNDKNWLTLYRGTSVSVTIDLGAEQAVSRVTFGELQLKAYGVYCSRWAKVYASADGEAFGLVGSAEHPDWVMSDAKSRVEYDIAFDAVRARYIRAVFSSDVFTMVDEISVYASESSDISPIPAPEKEEEKGFVDSESLDGIGSICLMYVSHGYTRETIKPYIAYVDKKGEVKDGFFDSLLFLSMPSTDSEDGHMRQADFEKYIDNVLGNAFSNLGALDYTFGEIKESIGYGKEDKYPVFVAMPDIGVFTDAFGVINGKTVTCADYESRAAVTEWFVDHFTERFNAEGFENVELKGFYRFAESIEYSRSPDEVALAKHFTDYCREKGFKSIWIPYYSAAGIDEALGFDAVTMQSGYAFNPGAETGEAKAGVTDNCAAICKKYGMGMEFELDLNVKGYSEKYRQYIHSAYRSGLMENGVMMMYQVGDHLFRCSESSTRAEREIYDLTYQYCSATYVEYAPVIEGAELTVAAESFGKGRFNVTDEDTPVGQLRVAEIEKPEGIYISVSGDGIFTVETYGSKPGTYITRFSVTDGYNISNTAEITIIVQGGEDDESKDASSSDAASGAEEKSGGFPVWLIIAGAAIILVAAAVFIIFRRSAKNK